LGKWEEPTPLSDPEVYAVGESEQLLFKKWHPQKIARALKSAWYPSGFFGLGIK